MFDALAKRLLQPINTSVISILGMFNVLVGIWIALPFTSIGKEYSTTFIPELGLGLVLAIVGTCVVLGSAKENYVLLSIGCAMGFILWLILMVLILVYSWRSPDWLVCFMISSYSGFVYSNISVNSKNLLNKK